MVASIDRTLILQAHAPLSVFVIESSFQVCFNVSCHVCGHN